MPNVDFVPQCYLPTYVYIHSYHNFAVKLSVMLISSKVSGRDMLAVCTVSFIYVQAVYLTTLYLTQFSECRQKWHTPYKVSALLTYCAE